MRRAACEGTAVTERPERTAHGYRRFRRRERGRQFNERSAGILSRARYPSGVIALVVFWRLRHKLSPRGLPEMFLLRGIEFSHETVREGEAKLTPALIDPLRRRRAGHIGRSWYADEIHIKIHGRGATCTGRSIALARWWMFTSARHATWRRRWRSSAPPERSPA